MFAAALLKAGAAAAERRDVLTDPTPWWHTLALGWVGMARAILDDRGEGSSGWRALFWKKLEAEPPEFLYAFYARWAER